MLVNRWETDHGPFVDVAAAQRFYDDMYGEHVLILGPGDDGVYAVIIESDDVPVHVLDEV